MRKNFSQIAGCMVNSADHTNVDRFMNNDLWSGTQFNDNRVKVMDERTKGYDPQQPGHLIADFAKKHAAFQTKIKLACELVEDAMARGLDFATVLFDSWYLAPELVETIERYHKAWISILKPNRNLESVSLKLYDEQGQRIVFDEPEIQVAEVVPRIPKSAYQAVPIGPETTYWA